MRPLSGATMSASRRLVGGVAGSVSVGVSDEVWSCGRSICGGRKVLIGGRTTVCHPEDGLSGANPGAGELARPTPLASASAGDPGCSGVHDGIGCLGGALVPRRW